MVKCDWPNGCEQTAVHKVDKYELCNHHYIAALNLLLWEGTGQDDGGDEIINKLTEEQVKQESEK